MLTLPWKGNLFLNIIVHQYCIVSRHFCAENQVRVRFAPSPTGFLHLGGLRTALYNYLFAKSNNGTFILRIEDTDRTRLVDDAVKKLENDLEWVGLTPDESPLKGGSYGPYLQSERLSLYEKEVHKLLKNGSAYYCFCDERRLNLIKKDAIRRREVPKYDNRCRHLSEEEIKEKLLSNSTRCIRFKLTPYHEPIEDLVYGSFTHDVSSIEGDPIIIKSDGYPTYHFANVVDDHHMKISHVLRGVEWQSSTTKHILLHKAFNWTPPRYAHLPLLMNEDGTKLSKRNSNMTMEAYKNDGIYPLAILNVIVSSGGGFVKNAKEEDKMRIKNLDELINTFRLELVNPNNCQLRHDLIDEFNRLAIRYMVSNEKTLHEMAAELKIMVKKHFSEEELIPGSLDSNKLEELLLWSSERIHRLSDLASKNFSYLWTSPSEETLLNQDKQCFELLEPIMKYFNAADDFNEIPFVPYLKLLAKDNKIKYPTLMKFLRTCLSGSTQGPSVHEMMIHLGRDSVIERLHKAECIYKNNHGQQTQSVT